MEEDNSQKYFPEPLVINISRVEGINYVANKHHSPFLVAKN